MDSDYLLHLLLLLILKNTFFLLLLYIYGTLPFSHTLQKLAWLSAAAISQARFFFFLLLLLSEAHAGNVSVLVVINVM